MGYIILSVNVGITVAPTVGGVMYDNAGYYFLFHRHIFADSAGHPHAARHGGEKISCQMDRRGPIYQYQPIHPVWNSRLGTQ